MVLAAKTAGSYWHYMRGRSAALIHLADRSSTCNRKKKEGIPVLSWRRCAKAQEDTLQKTLNFHITACEEMDLIVGLLASGICDS